MPDEHGDPFRFTTIAHSGRALLGPVAPGAVEALLASVVLARRAGSRPLLLDVGCGKGAMLLEAMRLLDADGIGVEPNPAFARATRAAARAMGLAGRLDLQGTGLEHAYLRPGSHDLVICAGAAHAFGDLDAALAGMAALARAGGWALLAHGYWRREPDPEYLAAFGGRAGELAGLDATLASPARHGWRCVAEHASTPAEWDDYERGYAAAMRSWLDTHKGDPDARAFGGRIESWSAAYERWGRDTMGYVTMLLRR